MKRACSGEEDFRSLIENNIYYIDKTAFIKDFVNDTHSRISLITRPGGFGKTLTLSMLREFFDITKKSDDIFSGLEIAEDKEFCDRHMNKYPVVFFSMKELSAETFEDFLDRFRELAVRQTEEHNYLLTSHHVSDCLKYVLKAARKLSCNKAQLQFFLVTFSRALHQHWGNAIQTTKNSNILSSLSDDALEKLKSNSNDILHHEGSVTAICWGIAFSHISCQAKCDAKEMALLPIA